MILSTNKFLSGYFFLQRVFLMFKVVFKKLMIYLRALICYHIGDNFGKVVVLIPGLESVNVQLEVIDREKLWPLQMCLLFRVSLHLFKSVFCVFECIPECSYPGTCIYFGGFGFSFITLLPMNNLQ